MTKQLIAFAGPAGSGKDTCGAYLIERYGFKRISYAGPIYDALEVMGFGRPTTQAEKDAVIPWLGTSWRYLAQTLGTEWGRERVHQGLWTMLVEQRLLNEPDQRFVITDLRFENEATMVRKAGGLVVHLRGRKAEGTLAHASEQGIAVYKGDVTLWNEADGVFTLRQTLDAALMGHL